MPFDAWQILPHANPEDFAVLCGNLVGLSSPVPPLQQQGDQGISARLLPCAPLCTPVASLNFRPRCVYRFLFKALSSLQQGCSRDLHGYISLGDPSRASPGTGTEADSVVTLIDEQNVRLRATNVRALYDEKQRFYKVPLPAEVTYLQDHESTCLSILSFLFQDFSEPHERRGQGSPADPSPPTVLTAADGVTARDQSRVSSPMPGLGCENIRRSR
jgi:hypothetical protein